MSKYIDNLLFGDDENLDGLKRRIARLEIELAELPLNAQSERARIEGELSSAQGSLQFITAEVKKHCFDCEHEWRRTRIYPDPPCQKCGSSKTYSLPG